MLQCRKQEAGSRNLKIADAVSRTKDTKEVSEPAAQDDYEVHYLPHTSLLSPIA